MLFDIDDTLYDHSYASWRAAAALRRADPRFRRVPLSRLYETAEAALSDVHRTLVLTGRVTEQAGRLLRMERLARALGFSLSPEEAGRLVEVRGTAYRASERAVPGSLALLRRLHDLEVHVGVVSNNLLASQRRKLAAVGLAPHVDSWTVSDEAGYVKPDPRIFRLALRRAGCRAADAVFLGDSWEWDVEGARSAGLAAVWFDRSRRPAPTGSPVVRLPSLAPADAAVAALETAWRDGGDRRS